MDIKNIVPTAEIEFTLDRKDGAGRPVTVKLKVNYVTLDEVGDFAVPGQRFRLSKAVREILIDAVVGWDLTEDGEPLACDDKAKRRVLPVLLGATLTDPRPEAARKDKDGKAIPYPNPFELILGRKLVDFAADERNYLKN
jgi:hypothetical protein